jgi:hypothetical protein
MTNKKFQEELMKLMINLSLHLLKNDIISYCACFEEIKDKLEKINDTQKPYFIKNTSEHIGEFAMFLSLKQTDMKNTQSDEASNFMTNYIIKKLIEKDFPLTSLCLGLSIHFKFSTLITLLQNYGLEIEKSNRVYKYWIENLIINENNATEIYNINIEHAGTK